MIDLQWISGLAGMLGPTSSHLLRQIDYLGCRVWCPKSQHAGADPYQYLHSTTLSGTVSLVLLDSEICPKVCLIVLLAVRQGCAERGT